MDVRSRGRMYVAVGDGIAAFVQSSVASIFCSVAASSCSCLIFSIQFIPSGAIFHGVARVTRSVALIWAMTLSSRFSAVTASPSFA